jgi:hypothetical protein
MKMRFNTLAILCLATVASAAPPLEKRATVAGKAFNRFVVIFLENTDYSTAAADSELTRSGFSRGDHTKQR